MGGFDGDRFARFALADEQEVRGGGIGGIVVVADVGVDAALFVIDGDKIRVTGFPRDLIRQHTPDALAVVDGNDLLQAHVRAQGGEVLKGELEVAAVQIAVHLIMVVHCNVFFALDARTRAAGGAADLARRNVRDDEIESVLVVDRQQQGIHTPRRILVPFVAGVDRDRVGFLESGELLRHPKVNCAGLARAHRFAGLLDGVFHRGVRGFDGVSNFRNLVTGYIVALQLAQLDLGGGLLDRQIRRSAQILGGCGSLPRIVPADLHDILAGLAQC